MGWAENRIEAYRRAEPATWLERRMLEHANPIHFTMSLAATVGFVYGLWTHDWSWIAGAVAVAALGHVYYWTRQDERTRRHPVLPPAASLATGARAG